MRRILLRLIRFYQVAVSPLLPSSCRYVPSCSEYALTAVRRFGAARGGWLAVRRVCRCHPFGGRGHDPVPPRPGGRPRREEPPGCARDGTVGAGSEDRADDADRRRRRSDS